MAKKKGSKTKTAKAAKSKARGAKSAGDSVSRTTRSPKTLPSTRLDE